MSYSQQYGPHGLPGYVKAGLRIVYRNYLWDPCPFGLPNDVDCILGALGTVWEFASPTMDPEKKRHRKKHPQFIEAAICGAPDMSKLAEPRPGAAKCAAGLALRSMGFSEDPLSGTSVISDRELHP